MAQELKFLIKDKEFVCSPTKVERAKMYGSTEKVILNDKNEPCKVVSMDESGTVIIPKGGIALGILNSQTEWIQRSELQVVNLSGQPVEQIPASFSNPI